MKVVANIQEAISNLSAAKLRSFLALLGILVGTASVVAMVSGGQLATNEALKQFKTLGTDLLSVAINDVPNENDTAQSSSDGISLPLALSLRSTDKHILDVAPYTQIFNPIQYEGHSLSGTILGVTESFGRIAHIQLAKGRFVSSLDGYGLFCVVGNKLYEQMKTQSVGDPLGKQLQIGSAFCTIVGVAKPWPENSFVYASVDNSIMIPISASLALSKYANISSIIIQLQPNSNIENVNANLKKYLNEVQPKKQLYLRSAKELIASMAKQSEILTLFLGLIGGISLLVGGIGVMNIMLVSVVERRREIGIRLAVGARQIDIRSLFLIEAIMLSLLGGFSGIVIGTVIEYILALLWHWDFIFFWLPPIIGFTVSVVTGIFFGYYPAYKASKLNPIEALRSD